MPTLNTIRTVSVRYQSEGADRFRSDAQAAADAQTNLAQATEQAATVTDQASRRQLSAASAYDRVRASVDANYRAQLALERATRTVDRALQQGIIDTAAYERTLAQIQGRFTTTATAADRAAAAWRNLGAVGAANSRLLTPEGRLSTLSSDGSVQYRPGMGRAANENAAGRRLRQDEATNLLYQGGDIAAQLGSGSPLSMIALQQGPQIAQIFAGPGGASIKGAFAQATEAVGGFLGKIGPVGLAFGGFTAVALGGAAALASYARSQDEVQKSLGALGRVAGVSVGTVNALADAQARLGGLSRREARGIAAGYGGTGQIGPEVIGGLLASTRDYARLTGQDLPEAAKEFGAAFADPVRGAEALNDRLAILNATQLEAIRRLDMQGDRLGAQRALLSAYRDGVRGLSDEISAWGRLMTTVGDTVSNAWDRLGRTIEKSLGGGTLDQQLAAATRRLKSLELLGPSGGLSEADQIYNFGGSRDDETARLREFVRGLQKQIQERDAAATKGQQNRASTEVDQIVRGLSPASAALKEMQDRAANISSKLSLLPLDESRRARDALTGMERTTEVIRDNLKAGGEQFAASLKQAQFDSSVVGFTDRGRSAAQIDFEFKSRAEQALRDGTASEQNARLQTLEIERTTRLQALERQSAIELNRTGGAFSRLNPEVQAQLQAGATRFGRVPLNYLAAIAEMESSGNLDIGFTKVLDENGRRGTAYGLGQVTQTTGNDLFRRYGIDRMNRATMGEALAGVLDMKLDATGGDIDRAIMAYRGSRDPSINRAYLAEVRRKAGEMGDTSVAGVARDQDANARAVQSANDNLKNITENYGRNAVALEANGRAQEQYRQMIERGVPAATAASVAFDGMQTKIASLGQTARFIQFQRDNAFARDQLGRTQIEQQAFAAARPYAGTQYEASVREQALDTARLYESKAAVTDAMGGFVTDLRRGTDAASAFSSMLGRLADRALNGLTDSLVSSLFSAGSKGGAAAGGLGGIFASIGSVFGFADGGLLTGPGGPRSDNLIVRASPGEYIINAAATLRHRDLLDAINGGGLPGFADGGPVPFAPSAPMPDGRLIPVPVAGGRTANANAGPAAVTSIDARTTINAPGADAAGLAQLKAYVDERDRQLPERIRELQRRAG